MYIDLTKEEAKNKKLEYTYELVDGEWEEFNGFDILDDNICLSQVAKGIFAYYDPDESDRHYRIYKGEIVEE